MRDGMEVWGGIECVNCHILSHGLFLSAVSSRPRFGWMLCDNSGGESSDESGRHCKSRSFCPERNRWVTQRRLLVRADSCSLDEALYFFNVGFRLRSWESFSTSLEWFDISHCVWSAGPFLQGANTWKFALFSPGHLFWGRHVEKQKMSWDNWCSETYNFGCSNTFWVLE